MLFESEIIAKHTDALKQAKQACSYLAQNADPDRAAPRGAHYKQLKTALKELEGSCRQMAHFRADARWLKLGIVYAKATRLSQVKFIGQRWADFGKMCDLFDNGLRRMQDLQTRRTGRIGPILPQRTDWLILPDQYRISQGVTH